MPTETISCTCHMMLPADGVKLPKILAGCLISELFLACILLGIRIWMTLRNFMLATACSDVQGLNELSGNLKGIPKAYYGPYFTGQIYDSSSMYLSSI